MSSTTRLERWLRAARTPTAMEAGALMVAVIALSLAAVLVLTPAYPLPVGVTIAEGGSMGHDAPQGILYVDTGDVDVGDEIVFDAGIDGFIHHRVVDEADPGYVTQGDAETYADQAAGAPFATESNIRGEVVASVPLSHPRVFALTSTLLLLSLFGLTVFRRRLTTQDRAPRDSLQVPRARQLGAVAFGVILAVSLIGPGVVLLPGVDSDHDGVAAADVTESTFNQSAGFGTQETDLEGVAFKSDGTKVYVTGPGSDSVHQYALSTAWDISTKSHEISFDVSTQTPGPRGLVFADNGNVMYVAGNGNGNIYKYTLSTPWNVSTASHHQTLDDSPNGGDTMDVYVNDDGTKLYAASDATTNVTVYEMPEANNLSTATYLRGFDVSGQTSNITDASFNSDGGKLIVTGTAQDKIYEYNLNTPYDLSTASYHASFDFTKDDAQSGRVGQSDTKLYIAGSTDDKVYSYDTDLASTDAVSGDITGRVLDQNGDPVENATVYATGWDTADPPQLNTRSLEAVLDEPLPTAWQDQISDTKGFSENPVFAASDARDQFDGTRVLMHTSENWELDTVPLTRGTVETVPSDVEARAITTPDDGQLFACWDFDMAGVGGLSADFGDGIDNSIIGAETTPCDSITVERVDPLNDTEYSRTVEPKPLIKSRAAANTGWSDDTGWAVKHHYGYRTDLDAGVYRVYPEEQPGQSMLYVVAPNNDPSELRAELKNLAGSEIERRTKFNDRMQELYNDGSIDGQSTTTNETGYYGLSVDTNVVTRAELRAVKGGSDLNVDPQNLSQDHLRENFEGSVRRQFNDATAASFETADEDTFQSVCERMDSVLDDVGSPFYGSTTTDVPNDNANIEGFRIIPPDTDPRVRQCAAFNIAELLAEDPLGLFPGFSGDLSDLSDQELLEYARQVLQLVNANPDLKSDIEDALGTDLPDNPDDLNDPDTARGILDDGLNVIDSPSGETNFGGDGGFVGGGDAPSVQDPEESADRVNETISRTWPVTGVDNWEDAGVLLRIEFSDGSEELVTPDSVYLSVEEHAVGPDHVHLDDYPFNTSDAAVARLSLDVATESGYDRDRGRARNPNFDGTIPGLRSLKVSATAPGKTDTITVGATPEDTAEWGGVQHVNVTGPNCKKQVNASDDEAVIEMCGAGNHRLAVTYQNADGTRFVEVLQVEARTASQARPPGVRAASGVTGRFAVAVNGLTDGHLKVRDGTSKVVLTGIVPADSDVPSRIVASTTGVDVARDATTTVRLRQGPTEQTIRQRVGVLLHIDRVSDDSLLYRNGRPIRNPGETADALVEQRNRSTVIDSFTGETAEMQVEVSRDPGLVERFWHGLRLRFPSLPVGFAVIPLSGTGAVAVVLFIGRPVRRRISAAVSGDQEVEA